MCDDKMDKDIKQIMNIWRSKGLKKPLSKPEVIRIMLERYKEDGYSVPKRKPKSKIWKI